MRPASPKRSLNNGDVASERPHTISTAYEKGHQRPQLQPYTFSPPGTYLHTRPQPFELYYTDRGTQNGTPRLMVFCFVLLDHLPVEKVPQMIYHLKALTQSFQNL